MRFNFRLDPLLNLKVHEEEEKREELRGIRKELEREEERLKSLKKRLLEFENEFKTKAAKGMTGSEIRDYLSIKSSIEFEIERTLTRIEKIKEMETQVLKEYLEKRKERKALEKLKERRWREFLEDLDSKDRKLLDEIAERKFWWSS